MSALPQPNDRWLDRYEIRRELGRGGFGRVYLAYDLRLDREVAIKVLRQSDDYSDTDLQRFRREINIAASLSHPNVVTVYDGGDHDGLSYLVMRYVEGRDLRHELREGPLPHARLVSVIEQIASALDYAHGRGLVHRDVKPANILCEVGSDRVYLADFGISRPVDQSTGEQVTQAGLGPATFYYAAPEQLRTGQRVDARTDIYAFGCVVYECLTARRPFEGKIAAVVGAHLTEPPPRVSDARPDLPPGWDEVVATAMAKDPDQRYQRCRDLAAVVARLATDGDTFADERALAQTVAVHRGSAGAVAGRGAPGPGPPQRPQRPAPVMREPVRPRRGGALVAALVALLVLLGVWMVWFLPSLPRDSDGEPQVSAGDAPPTEEDGLDEAQRALVEATGTFGMEDCRPTDSRSFAGQTAAVACSSEAHTPTRVVYRAFGDEAARDAALEELAAGRRTGADCRVGNDATHGYRGAAGEGRVVCNVADGIAGLTWTVPGGPILGTARLDDVSSLNDLYTWWDGVVERDPADRLPDGCAPDQGLMERGASRAVQCQLTGGVATVVSHAQFPDLAAMDAWYDGMVTGAREDRPHEVHSGGDHTACTSLGSGAQRWVAADVTWALEDSGGRLLCMVNESDQNAMFWTDERTGIGAIAVSPASGAPLAALVEEWASGPYRVVD